MGIRANTVIPDFAGIGQSWLVDLISFVNRASQMNNSQRNTENLKSIPYLGDQMKSAPLCTHLPWVGGDGYFQTYFAQKPLVAATHCSIRLGWTLNPWGSTHTTATSFIFSSKFCIFLILSQNEDLTQCSDFCFHCSPSPSSTSDLWVFKFLSAWWIMIKLGHI